MGQLDRSPKSNWVEKSGGLPKYIERIALHLKSKGMETGHAIATAVNAAKKMCASGDLNWPGSQKVNAGSRAEACRAVADWNAKKAKAKSTSHGPNAYEAIEMSMTPGEALTAWREVMTVDLSGSFNKKGKPKKKAPEPPAGPQGPPSDHKKPARQGASKGKPSPDKKAGTKGVNEPDTGPKALTPEQRKRALALAKKRLKKRGKKKPSGVGGNSSQDGARVTRAS